MREKTIKNLTYDTPALREVGLKLAKVQDGINLAQGLCFLPTPGLVTEAALSAIGAGQNLYSPAQGRPELVSALQKKLCGFNQIPCERENIVVTVGATGAFEAVCSNFIEPGDEIITFVPFYPYHRNALVPRKAKLKLVKLNEPDWSFDFRELEAAFTERTKFVLLSNPHNPTGKVFSRPELERIGAICRERKSFCVIDEVYEYMTYDGLKHCSMASLPGLFDHTITMGSYSKTFAITGWRIGYVVAPNDVIDMLKNACDQIYVCAPTPLQLAVAAGISDLGEEYYLHLHEEYTRKRKILEEGLRGAGLEPYSPQGAYYILADTRNRFPGLSSEEAVDIMVKNARVGAVPASDFLGPEVKGNKDKSTFMRFCFAVDDKILNEASRRLLQL